MTKDEALNLAMDWYGSGNQDPDEFERLILSIVAQPEHDGECKYCTDGCPACDARKLPEQEPVGYASEGAAERLTTVKQAHEQIRSFRLFTHEVPLYTTPPQRPWVGLTEDEAFACQGRDYFETYKAIEAKLKEKNT